MNNKLLFGLCFKCMQNSMSGVCIHSDDERAITGTWCSPELQVAIKKGYRVVKIYEVYHFNNSSQFNQQAGTKGLFSDYVNTFLRIKQEASGFPVGCISHEQKLKYIDDYYINEGIKLEYDQIKPNPGLRALAKLFLNSFWGRYGMRSNLMQTEIISDIADFHFLIHDETKNVNNFHSISDDYIIVQWTYKDKFENEARNTNIFLASFTSMYGRLKLYDELDKLGERVIYYDTDSVIYIERENVYNPKLGSFLGDLTSELVCKEVGCKMKDCKNDHSILEFVSGGPKNYAYKIDTDMEVCKVKGFSLNYTNNKIINFNSMRELLKDGVCSDTLETEPTNRICRNKNKALLFNRMESRKYRICYTKRQILDDLTTVPFGYF